MIIKATKTTGHDLIRTGTLIGAGRSGQVSTKEIDVYWTTPDAVEVGQVIAVYWRKAWNRAVVVAVERRIQFAFITTTAERQALRKPMSAVTAYNGEASLHDIKASKPRPTGREIIATLQTSTLEAFISQPGNLGDPDVMKLAREELERRATTLAAPASAAAPDALAGIPTDRLERMARDARIVGDRAAQDAIEEELERRELLNAPAPAPAPDPRDRYFTHGCGADVKRQDAELVRQDRAGKSLRVRQLMPAPVATDAPKAKHPVSPRPGIPAPADFNAQARTLGDLIREHVRDGDLIQLRGGDRWFVVYGVEPDFGWDAIRGHIVDHTRILVVPVSPEDERDWLWVSPAQIKPKG